MKLSLVEFQTVPNVPCGVESFSNEGAEVALEIRVPNVPCGVERNTVLLQV